MRNHTDTIHKIGLSRCPGEYIELFTQVEIPNKILLAEQLPDIYEITSLIVSPEILSIESVDTVKSRKKIIVKIRIHQKILYICCNDEQSIHVFENQCDFNCSILIPDKINGSDPEMLIKNKLLTADIYVEDISVNKLNMRSIYENIFVLAVINQHLSYELCCSIYDNNNCSNIFIMFDDGTNILQKTHCRDLIIREPVWLPATNDIAFIESDNISDSLCSVDRKIDYQKYLIEPSVFKHIESLNPIGNKIIFSAVKEGLRQIFSLEIDSLVCRQLTYTDSIMESFRPECSPDDKNIAFLRSISGIVDLWSMNEGGLECRKLTSSGYIKDFDWSHSSDRIIYIEENNIDPDKIIMKDLKTLKDSCILKSTYPCTIRKLLCSPTADIIAFINSAETKEDIYIYNLKGKQLFNITNNADNVKIGDISWKGDGSKLYYSSDELEYFNIYSISLSDPTKYQLTNITASKIELGFKK